MREFILLEILLHGIHPLARCHHKLVLHLDSELSLDLRAHRSAILVSMLSTLVLKTLLGLVHSVDLFRLHFSVQVEIESLLGKDWKQQPHIVLVQHFLKM